MRSLFVCYLIGGSLFAQPPASELTPTPERFDRAMAITAPTARQLDTIIQLGAAYSFIDRDSCLLLGKRAVALGRTLNKPDLLAQALLELANSYRVFGAMDAAETALLEGKALYQELGADGQVAKADNILGALHVNRGQYEPAIDYYLRALATWETLRDSQNIIKPLINIAVVFHRLGREEKAIEYNQRAVAWADLIQDDRGTMYALNNLAIIYNDRAIAYQQRADTSSTHPDPYRDSAALFIQHALDNYSQATVLARGLGDQRSLMQFLNNSADLKITEGAYREAIALCEEGQAISLASGAMSTVISNKINMAKAYRLLGQPERALAYGQEALQLATANSMEKERASAQRQLHLIYRKAGNFERALENYEAYQSYVQGVNDTEKNKAIAEVESRYQTVQKEKQILEQENEILALEQTQAWIERQRNFFIGGGLLVGLLSFLGLRLKRVRRERNDKIAFAEALLFAQENERKRIASDLHDGIGQSLLLIKRQMEASQYATQENRQLIAATLEEVRSISRDLHPFQLEKFGLTAALREIVHKVETATDLFLTHEIDSLDGKLSAQAEISIYRTVQEALSNVVKHAGATAAKVSVYVGQTEIKGFVQDNGRGFDRDGKSSGTKSLGLQTMTERISSIGGQLKIGSNRPKGTLVHFTVPITGVT